MSQFGGSKNPPWSSLGTANPGAHHQVIQAQPLMGLGPTAAGLYNQQMAATAGNNTLAMQAQMQANAMQAQAQAQAALQPQAHVMSMQQPLGAQGMAVAVTAPSSQLTVSYPTGGRQSQTNQPKQRVFMGTVTKLHDTFGFLDEDVFFQTSTVKGVMPKVGEKVLVEATFNPNMPFKWNATRVQPLPNQVPPSGSNLTAQQLSAVGINQMVQQQSGGMNPPPPLMGMGMHNQQQGILGNPPQAALNSISNRRNDTDRRRIDRNREREERERERIREQQERDNRDRKREQREREHREQERKEKEREKERDRSPIKIRSRSPRRSPKRARKSAPRYVVQVPRFPLDISNANVLELRKRYTNLYIPSDFFLAGCSYQDAFPLGRPFNTAHPCGFHMMPKDVEPISKNNAVLEPPDISYQFSAKVMLLTSVSEEEFYRNCCARVEDSIDVRDNFQHPARILSFLVGSRGKNEVMAIGGPWSPSLDGADPANDKSVLIRTAIRTTKALAGIDLSACGQWYRFLEIRYHRGEQKGRLKPRVETVVIFVPDVWNLTPTKTEWEALSASYKKKFMAKYSATSSSSSVKKEAVSPPPPSVASQMIPKQQPQQEKSVTEEKVKIKVEEQVEKEAVVKTEESSEQVLDEMEEDRANAAENEPKTHWNDLDPKTMKVQELREELDSRGLNLKGLKSQLVARLTKAIKKEEEEEIAKQEEDEAEELTQKEEDNQEQEQEAEGTHEMMVVEEINEDDSVKGQENGSKTEEKEEVSAKATPPAAGTPLDPKEAEEKKKREEKEKQLLERKYTLPDTPSILVHPSASAKGGKFECTITNLSVLLDYRPEDTKEHSFEVSLFAELFNELLQRDFAFNIYQAILKAPEKKEEKKEEKKDKKEKKEDKKEDKEKKDEKKDEKKEEKKEERKDEKKEEDGEEPKTKKRKVEDKEIDEQTKADEKKDEGKEKKQDSTVIEDGKKEEKKKDEKGNKVGNKNRSSSQENIPKGKVETLDPSLLLSCVYFDQNHCGFILDKDLEDLLNCLGLNLSRAQVRKLMHKVLSRDTWHYRKMTDGIREKDKDENSLVKEETNGPTVEEPYRGNLTLLESLRVKSAKLKAGGDVGTGMVTFQGALVDLASVMSRLKKSEHQRKQDENKINQLQKESDKWKAAANSSQESIKSLDLDVENLRKKLHETEDSLRSSKRKNDDFRSCVEKAHKGIEDISSRFKVVLDREDRKEKDKEKKTTASSSSDKKDNKT